VQISGRKNRKGKKWSGGRDQIVYQSTSIKKKFKKRQGEQDWTMGREGSMPQVHSITENAERKRGGPEGGGGDKGKCEKEIFCLIPGSCSGAGEGRGVRGG